MPEPTPPVATGSPSTSPAGNANGEPPKQADTPVVKYVTVEEHEKLLKRLDAQSAILNRLEKGTKEPVAPAPEQKTAPDNLAGRVSELEARAAKLDQRENVQKERDALQAIQSAMASSGVDPAQAPRFAKMFMAEHKDKIEVVEENGQWVPKFKEASGSTSIQQYIPLYLNTDDGKILLPPKRNPVVPSGNAGTSSVPTVSRQQLATGQVSTDAILKGQVVVKD